MGITECRGTLRNALGPYQTQGTYATHWALTEPYGPSSKTPGPNGMPRALAQSPGPLPNALDT
jgi:hypothetical protein